MSLNFLKNNSYLFISIALIIFAVLPLFHPGFFTIHDNEQIGRLYELDQALKSGQFPVRIVQDLGFGFGYLLFNFYPPAVYYLGELFHLLQFSFIDSIKIVMGIGFIFSAVFMYLLVKELFGKTGALVASVFYTYAPYHSVDLYVRGALSEFFSFVFLPAIFWSYLKLSKDNSKRYVVSTSLFNFLLVITHNLVALMASFFVFVWVLFLLYSSKSRKKLSINIFLTLLFSALISSFFVIPALLENKFTMVSLLTKELADYNIHFVYPIQFWNSVWGYGGSAAGLADGLSFNLGKLYIFLVLVSALLSVYFFIKRKLNKVIPLFLIFFLLSLFLQTSYSKIVWDNFNALSYLQFPWRFLIFSAFFSSFLVGSIFSFIKNEKLGLVAGLCAVFLVVYFEKKYFVPQNFLNNSDEYYTNQKFLRFDTSKMSFEYVPKGIATKKSEIGNTVVDIDDSQIAKSTFTVVSGKMLIETKKDSPNEKIMKVTVLKDGTFRLNEYYYPGWTLYVDGQKIAIRDDNKLKLITFNLSSGEHSIKAVFEDTTIRKISNYLSLTGVILIILYALFPTKKYEKA